MVRIRFILGRTINSDGNDPSVISKTIDILL